MSDTRPCPYCAEEIKADALLCKHCHSELRANTSTHRPSRSRRGSGGVVALLLLVVAAGGAIFVIGSHHVISGPRGVYMVPKPNFGFDDCFVTLATPFDVAQHPVIASRVVAAGEGTNLPGGEFVAAAGEAAAKVTDALDNATIAIKNTNLPQATKDVRKVVDAGLANAQEAFRNLAPRNSSQSAAPRPETIPSQTAGDPREIATGVLQVDGTVTESTIGGRGGSFTVRTASGKEYVFNAYDVPDSVSQDEYAVRQRGVGCTVRVIFTRAEYNNAAGRGFSITPTAVQVLQ